jgi:hypothetical protein
MQREHADSVMQRLLIERHFDFRKPSVKIAWAAFQEFIRIPLEGLTTVTFGVEVSQYRDCDNILWVSFMRVLEESGGVGWYSGGLLSRPAPIDLVGVNQQRYWWAEHSTIEQWISEVEQMPSFTAVIALQGWKWEGFSE